MAAVSNRNPNGNDINSDKNYDNKKPKPIRRKPVYFWTNSDVVKWLWRQCTDTYTLYGHLFTEHDITGRTLVRMNEISLEKLGISNQDHRDALWQEILKLRLRTDILEMRDLESKN
uniref:SAM domain-containing protein n=1 Tax=Strigamia maritima TaxID=126957 RepID=T1J8M7_STRMM